jgi:hypothetical protein
MPLPLWTHPAVSAAAEHWSEARDRFSRTLETSSVCPLARMRNALFNGRYPVTASDLVATI